LQHAPGLERVPGAFAAFLSPDAPGSILDGAPNFAATGSTLPAADTDLAHLLSLVRNAKFFIMAEETATHFSLFRGSGGAAAFPDIGPSGGELLGLQVLISSAAETSDSPTANVVAAISPSSVFYSDEGRVVLSISNAASLEMTDTPTGSASEHVSLWQTNSTATRAVKESAWYARSGAAAYYTCDY
jgi:hypothetical protein